MLGLGALAVVFGALYALARRRPGSDEEAMARKALATSNAAANGTILTALGHPVIGVAAGAMGVAAAYEDVARRPVAKRLLGWASWILPMSWPVSLVGALTLAGDVLAHAITGGRWERARIRSIRFDGATGTVVTEGGLLAMPGFHGGFNFGVFSFMTPGAGVVETHEAGHALNLAAFGWIFHLIGGFERKVLDDPATAYAERLAESNRSPSRRTDWVGHWGEPEPYEKQPVGS
jgi:hypothetical protein